MCEVGEGIRNQERAVAELAFGRPVKGQPMRFTILVPTSISLAGSPSLVTTHEGDAPVVGLTWRRCTPGGCIADAVVPDDVIQRIAGWTEPARVNFTDAAGQVVALPFSPRGLTEALNALAGDEAG